MPFRRRLDDAFIETLNKLYQDEKSWWHKLADDRHVFIAIRNNTLNAYVNGGSVGKITWNEDSVALMIHPAYLIFLDGASRNSYANLLDPDGVPEPIVIKNIEHYVTHFAKIKNAVRLLTGSERRGENRIAAKIEAVVDIEAAFGAVAESSDSEFEDASLGPGRVDLVAVAEDGRIVCTEAKLFANSELRSVTAPAVCGQLISYHQWLKKSAEEIQTAYTHVCGYYERLKGSFFEHRPPSAGRRLSVDPIPRLLIFGFDSHQRKSFGEMKERIRGEVKDQIPGFKIEHIRAVGTPQNVRAPKIL